MPLALVIEDDEDIARMFQLALQEAGLTVDVIHNGRRAQEWLAAHEPAVIVVDLGLPFVSGIEIVKSVKREPRLAGCAVIVASGNPQMSDEVYDLADLVLLKPISFEQLRDMAARLS